MKTEQYFVQGWTLAVLATAFAHDGKHWGEVICLLLSCVFVVYGKFANHE